MLISGHCSETGMVESLHSSLPSAPGQAPPSTERSHVVETMLPACTGAEDAEDVCPGHVSRVTCRLMRGLVLNRKIERHFNLQCNGLLCLEFYSNEVKTYNFNLNDVLNTIRSPHCRHNTCSSQPPTAAFPPPRHHSIRRLAGGW